MFYVSTFALIKYIGMLEILHYSEYASHEFSKQSCATSFEELVCIIRKQSKLLSYIGTSENVYLFQNLSIVRLIVNDTIQVYCPQR